MVAVTIIVVLLILALGAWYQYQSKKTVEMAAPPLGEEVQQKIRQKMLYDSTNSNTSTALLEENALIMRNMSEEIEKLKKEGRINQDMTKNLSEIMQIITKSGVLDAPASSSISTNLPTEWALTNTTISTVGKNNSGVVGSSIAGNNNHQVVMPITINNNTAPVTPPPPTPTPKAKEDVGGGKPQCNKHASTSGSTTCWVCDGEPSKTLKITSDTNSKPGDTKDWSATINPGDSLQIEIASGIVVTFGLSTSSSFEVYLHVNGEYVPWTPESSPSALSDSDIHRARVRLKPGHSAETLYLRAICKN
jgi:hypothetical protein